jgi:hypothetical protein
MQQSIVWTIDLYQENPMRLANSYILNPRNLALAICFVFSVLNVAQAQTPDANKIWTTVGSVGTIDETDVSKVFLDHGMVQMGHVVVTHPVAGKRADLVQNTQSAVIRYNVTPVDGLLTITQQQPCTGACSAYKLTLRYLATGANAHVVANLIEVDMATGAEAARLTFNRGLPSANGYHVQSGDLSCGPGFLFDFKRKAYYIEATLTGNSLTVGSAAGIQMIKIETAICP